MTTSEQRISEIQSIALSPSEKQTLRQQLHAYSLSYIPSRGISARTIQWFARHSIATAGMAVILIGGATSVSANWARPGDALYGFRLSVNDKIETALARDADAQIDVEMRQLQRMIDDEEALRDDELSAVGFISDTNEIEREGTRGDEVKTNMLSADDGSLERELQSLDQELKAEENAQLELE